MAWAFTLPFLRIFILDRYAFVEKQKLRIEIGLRPHRAAGQVHGVHGRKTGHFPYFSPRLGGREATNKMGSVLFFWRAVCPEPAGL
jgi:hypothetical protein